MLLSALVANSLFSFYKRYVSKQLIKSFESRINTFDFELGYLVEGREEEELPEGLIGCVRCDRPEFERAMGAEEFFGSGGGLKGEEKKEEKKKRGKKKDQVTERHI